MPTVLSKTQPMQEEQKMSEIEGRPSDTYAEAVMGDPYAHL